LLQFGGTPSGDRLVRMEQSPHFKDGKFYNPPEYGKRYVPDYWQMTKHWLFGIETRVPPYKLPIEPLDRYAFRAPAEGLEAIWLGHSTVILEMEGHRLITDPTWSERCSPLSVIGPKRFFPPPLPLKELPPIDAVVISHDHYDHLDMEAIRALSNMGTMFIVPLGIGAHLEKWGVKPKQIHELDWWDTDSTSVPGLRITATPARHFSGRVGLYGNSTLWASYVITGNEHRIYFSGDTGPFPGFKEIGERLGPFDLAMIKIGAYSQYWPDMHLNPKEAVDAYKAVKGKVLLPIHWGTFNLAFHDWDEPIEWLLKVVQTEGVNVITPEPGERVDVMAPPESEVWWRKE